MTIRDYARVLRKRWVLVASCVLGALLVAAALTFPQTPQYASTATLFVSSQAEDTTASSAYQGGLFSQQRVKSYADLITGPRVAETVVQQLGLTEPASQVQRRISATAVPDTVLLQTTATDPSPGRAQQIADAVGTSFAQLVGELERPVDGGPSPVKVSVVERAQLPTSPVSPDPLRNLGLALVLGLLAGVGLAVLREALDTSVKSAQDVADATGGLATLGTVPYDPDAGKRPLLAPEDATSRRAEALRQLRTNLQFVDVAGGPLASGEGGSDERGAAGAAAAAGAAGAAGAGGAAGAAVLVITSSLPVEGKSTTACNLAITLAQAGVRVLLVEADLRRPRLMQYLGLEGAVGLTSVLIGQAGLDDAVQSWGDDLLDVLPSGPTPPNPSELLGSPAMRRLLDRLRGRYDVVLLDTPPLLPVTDAAVLAASADGALVVVRAGRTTREQLASAVAALRAVDARLLGAVLSMVRSRTSSSYDYGYSYAAESDRRSGRWRLLGRSPRDRTSRRARGPESAAPVAVAPVPLRPTPDRAERLDGTVVEGELDDARTSRVS